MALLVADTFTSSLTKLASQEQKAVKVTAFELQMDPSSPGNAFHRLDRGRDKNFWSVRVNSDIRIIVHKQGSSVLLAYVGHHDDAYHWGERRKLERHPTTGAMQIVEVKEVTKEVETFTSGPQSDLASAPEVGPEPKPLLFDKLRKPELMAFGIPEEWIEDVRQANEDTLLDVISHLPQESQEALLRLAVGESPEPPLVIEPEEDPYSHPDAQRRFRIMTNVEELRQALEYPWEKWAVFLHPDQNVLVQRDFSAPARVAGSAGTGKTIVAIHRAAYLGRLNTSAKILLTTFTKPLANAIKSKLALLISDDERLLERINVDALNNVGYDLYSKAFGPPNIPSSSQIHNLLKRSAESIEGHKFSTEFIISEWSEVVDAWQLTSWDAYRDVTRLGRRTRVGGNQREILWSIFKTVRKVLVDKKLVTWSDIFGRLTEIADPSKPAFDYAIVDESQDLSVAQARFLAAHGGDRQNALFFAGDSGQRIFQIPFSWKSLGLDVRGRSSTLRINYRTSHQIRAQSDKLLPPSISDIDGLVETRTGTVSLFDGPPPDILIYETEEDERDAVSNWIEQRITEGCKAEEIAIFVRSSAQLARAKAAAKNTRCKVHQLDEKSDIEEGSISVSTMHLAKGHEFRVVIVMACDDDVLPLNERIETAADEGELEEIYNTERHLLYVACTRARDWLLVTGVALGSEFLADMREN
ncbi:MAG: UvrD-helicase domain-containing protein [Parcubacteria group bacterium]|nr:UvrD-helicase domain-containing protein [Parcubacteria group bacterium]